MADQLGINMNRYSEFFWGFEDAPESQITLEMKEKVVALGNISDEELTGEKVLDILNEIVYGSLASDFVVSALDFVWKELTAKQLAKAMH